MCMGCVWGLWCADPPMAPQEDCALDNVWLMGGLSIVSSVPITAPLVCLLCASKGHHEVSAPPHKYPPTAPPRV